MRYVFFLFMTIVLFSSPSWANDIRDVKPPVDFPPNFLFLFFMLLIFIALIALFFAERFLKLRANGEEKVVIKRDPWEIAYEKLSALKSEDLPGKGEVKKYYTKLSDITRYYIEDRFSIKAPEMTTEEFLRKLKDSRNLTTAQKGTLSSFLNCCDMVKFAKYTSDIQEMEESFDLAKQLVDETKQQEQRV